MIKEILELPPEKIISESPLVYLTGDFLIGKRREVKSYVRKFKTYEYARDKDVEIYNWRQRKYIKKSFNKSIIRADISNITSNYLDINVVKKFALNKPIYIFDLYQAKKKKNDIYNYVPYHYFPYREHYLNVSKIYNLEDLSKQTVREGEEININNYEALTEFSKNVNRMYKPNKYIEWDIDLAIKVLPFIEKGFESFDDVTITEESILKTLYLISNSWFITGVYFKIFLSLDYRYLQFVQIFSNKLNADYTRDIILYDSKDSEFVNEVVTYIAANPETKDYLTKLGTTAQISTF